MTNEELDVKVLETIQGGTTRAGEITGRLTANYRDVDRSLQRLRRKNKIAYASPVQGWKVVA